MAVVIASAQQNNIPPPNANCSPFANQVPAGQQNPTTIEPTYAIWCYTQPAAGPATRVTGTNDWVDTWDNDGPSIEQLNDHTYGYRRFDFTSNNRIAVGYFVNANHWMPDIGDSSSYSLSGGSMLSPDRTFSFEDGTLVVEGDMAAGSDGMDGANAFYEIDISPARSPTGITVDPLYGYGEFGGVGAMGCRFERQADGGHVVCAMYDNSTRDAGGTDVRGGPSGLSGRVWEAQGVGSSYTAPTVQGGYPGWQIPGTSMHVSDVWRQCSSNELDLHCRDRFRMEVTSDSLHIYVNGYLIYRIEGLYATNPHTGADNRIPASWLNGVAAYYTSWINSGIHHPTRWHWDRLAVNPHANGAFAAPSASPSFCLGMAHNTCPDPSAGGSNATPQTTLTSTPTATPARASTSTPTATPVRAATLTPTSVPELSGTSSPTTVRFDDLSPVARPLDGVYPNAVIDWGSGAWYLSGPYGSFETNSVSFVKGLNSASLALKTPRTLVAVDVVNGGTTTSTVTVACGSNATKKVMLQAGQSTTIQTDWTSTCSSVTFSSSNGWFVNFDNLELSGS